MKVHFVAVLSFALIAPLRAQLSEDRGLPPLPDMARVQETLAQGGAADGIMLPAGQPMPVAQASESSVIECQGVQYHGGQAFTVCSAGHYLAVSKLEADEVKELLKAEPWWAAGLGFSIGRVPDSAFATTIDGKTGLFGDVSGLGRTDLRNGVPAMDLIFSVRPPFHRGLNAGVTLHQVFEENRDPKYEDGLYCYENCSNPPRSLVTGSDASFIRFITKNWSAYAEHDVAVIRKPSTLAIIALGAFYSELRTQNRYRQWDRGPEGRFNDYGVRVSLRFLEKGWKISPAVLSAEVGRQKSFSLNVGFQLSHMFQIKEN